MKWVNERFLNIPCQKDQCHYWDNTYNDNCSNDPKYGQPFIKSCKGYNPRKKEADPK